MRGQLIYAHSIFSFLLSRNPYSEIYTSFTKILKLNEKYNISNATYLILNVCVSCKRQCRSNTRRSASTQKSQGSLKATTVQRGEVATGRVSRVEIEAARSKRHTVQTESGRLREGTARSLATKDLKRMTRKWACPFYAVKQTRPVNDASCQLDAGPSQSALFVVSLALSLSLFLAPSFPPSLSFSLSPSSSFSCRFAQEFVSRHSRAFLIHRPRVGFRHGPANVPCYSQPLTGFLSCWISLRR